jgi:hypothetical protein
MKSITFASESTPRPVVQIVLILLVMIIGIVSTLMICEWLFTLLIADKNLNALQQNYGSHSGVLQNLI